MVASDGGTRPRTSSLGGRRSGKVPSEAGSRGRRPPSLRESRKWARGCRGFPQASLEIRSTVCARVSRAASRSHVQSRHHGVGRSCDNASKTCRHFGHVPACTPIADLFASPVPSAIKFASCSRLGQPIIAIPRIIDCRTASRKTFACYFLSYHALTLKIHLGFDTFFLAAVFLTKIGQDRTSENWRDRFWLS